MASGGKFLKRAGNSNEPAESLCAAAIYMATTLLARSKAEMLKSDPAKEILLLAFREGLCILKADGAIDESGAVEAEKSLWAKLVAKRSKSGKTNSPQASWPNGESGGPARADETIRSLLARGRELGIPCPVIEKLQAILKAYRG